MNPTIINFPTLSAEASDVSWELQRFDGRFTSPLAGTFQDVIRPGARWMCTLSWKTLTYADAQALMAWSVQMAKGGVRTPLPNYAYTQQETIYGTPVVNGAGQTGNALVTDGWDVSINGVLLPGDMFQVTNGTLHQLLMVIAQANSDVNGNSTILFEPALRFSPTTLSGLVLTSPPAYFSFAKPSAATHYTPPRIASIALSLIEDIQV